MQQNDGDKDADDHLMEHEDQVMNDKDDEADTKEEGDDENLVDDEDVGEEDDAEEGDNKGNDDNKLVHNEEIQLEEEEGLANINPPQPLPYKHLSWSKQDGFPDILRPHPTHTSSMFVGQDGTYLLLLWLAAALPSLTRKKRRDVM